MRKRVLGLAGAVAALTIGAAVMAPAAFAGQANSLYSFGAMCLPVSSQCINDVLGAQYNGAPQQFWSLAGGGANNQWNVWNAGTVDCTPNSFPFYTTNSDLLLDCSEFWSGKVVLKLAFAPNGKGSGLCLDSTKITSDTINAVRSQLFTCVPAFSQTQSQYFIYTSSNWLVSVYGTKLSWAVGANNTFWIGSCPGSSFSNADPICLTAVSPQPFTPR